MAGKFINTRYYDSQESILNMHTELLQNPFYAFNDKKGTRVKYYNINKEKSTLDPGSKLAYTDIGNQSPIRFNIIKGLYLFQFIKAELNFDNGEFGLEANQLSGESYIIPNTIVPYDGDFFEVDHIHDSTWLFKVTDVQRDTLENGANVYKISWVLDRTTNVDILKNIVDVYRYVDVIEGTNVKSIIKEEKYDIAKKLDDLSVTLIKYFKELFYNKYVQTFIYKWYNEYCMYDPFAIEFIIRNKLLYTNSDYLAVDHKIAIPASFSIDYNKTLYRAFEERDLDRLFRSQRESQADYIDDLTSIFNTRYEAYFALNYRVVLEENGPFNPKGIIPIMEQEFFERINHNKKYPPESNFSYRNMIIRYFNKEDIKIEDIENIDKIDLLNAKDIYYDLLFIIFCVGFYTKSLLS